MECLIELKRVVDRDSSHTRSFDFDVAGRDAYGNAKTNKILM